VGSLFSSLDIALSGLQASQIQLEVAGHNIANVNKEGFSRQRVNLITRVPNLRSYGIVGRGVDLSNVERIREGFLDKVFRQQIPSLGNTEIQAGYFTRIEDIFQEPTENGFGARLNYFFDALNDFSNNVEELPVRISVLTEAESLVTSLQEGAERVFALRTNANEEVRNLVPEVNSLSERIAALNVRIRAAEVGGNTANDLRDDRDLLLDELAELVNIGYQEREDGQVDVFVSGDVLITGSDYRELVATRDPTLDPDRADLVEVRFADTDRAVDVHDGQLRGALDIRDGQLVQVGDRIDQIAAAIIREVNQIHCTGNGLVNLSGMISSTNPVSDAGTPLPDAGLPFAVTAGTFDVIVYDAAGTPSTTTITVEADTSLDDLAAALNAIPNFAASVTGNALELGATGSYTYSFANDTSGALTALGINGLFQGHDATTIRVNADLIDDPRLLTSGYSTDLLDTGDNTAALALANVRNLRVLESDSATINEYYESTIVRVGVDARANTDLLEIERSFVDDFRRRREEVSGVSLDEEVTFMLQYQKAFEASARVITVADRMLDVLLAMAL